MREIMVKVKYSRKVIQQLEGEDYPFGGHGQSGGSFAQMFDPHSFDKLAGKYQRQETAGLENFSSKGYPPVQESLDLHGCTIADAERKTTLFLAGAQKKGLRTLEIITGKGLHSPGGKAVLPDAVEQHLRLLKKQGDLLAFRWEKRLKAKSGKVLIYL